MRVLHPSSFLAALVFVVAGCSSSTQNTDAAVDVAADHPADGAADVASDAASDAAEDTAADVSTDAAADVPADAPSDVAADVASDASQGFQCGASTCDPGAQYCGMFSGGPIDLDAGPARGVCQPFPAACASDHTCACLRANGPCGIAGTCAESAGGLIYTCRAP